MSTHTAINEKADCELYKDEKALCSYDPFFLVEGGFLRIKTKDADLVEFKPNKTQIFVIKAIKELRKLGKPVRIWIRKARQEGISTVVEAIIFAFTSQRENVNALIMADEKEHANNLFEMSKLYHSKLGEEYPHLAPALKKSNEKKLEFEDTHSQIIIATAENTEAARSHTFQIVHLSENAYFRAFKEVMLGLNQSVPDSNNTIIIGETTSNGSEESLEEWEKAILGKSAWTALFIPWFWLAEYSMKLVNNTLYSLDGIVYEEGENETAFLNEEKELTAEFKLTNEQLNWRRWAIVNKCGGNINAFRQEYPATWQESIRMSGNVFFSRRGMKKQNLNAKDPVGEGNLYKDMYNEIVFRVEATGKIRMYDHPEGNEVYLVTADASKARGIDEASAYVGNIRLNQTVAVVSGMYDEDELADVCVLLGEYYNNAMVVPENSCGYGNAVTKRVHAQYNNLYLSPEREMKGEIRPQDYGFLTTAKSRSEMLSYHAEEIRIGSKLLIDKPTIRQHEKFVINPKNKKAEAANNGQDGLVMCAAIFTIVRRTMDHILIQNKRERRRSVPRQPVKRNAGITYGR